MFTLDQIKAAHSKVKSGADFPAYFNDLGTLGVTFYETFVGDGHTCYHGRDGFELISPPKFEKHAIAVQANGEQLKKDLAVHQQGGSDYLQFMNECAENGVEKWSVCMEHKTCSYFDRSGNALVVEKIPS